MINAQLRIIEKEEEDQLYVKVYIERREKKLKRHNEQNGNTPAYQKNE